MVIRFNDEEPISSGPSTSIAEDHPDWLWAPVYDPTCGEYNAFLTGNNSIGITRGSSEAAITNVRVVLNNTFAPLPIAGHSYASAQFIGRGSTEVSFQIASLGTRPLSRIQSMMEEVQKNAREFRRIRKAATVDFSNNEFLALFGIEDGIVSSFDTETDSRGTNLYRGTLSFTSEGHHNEEFHQEAYRQSSHQREVVDRLLDFFTVATIRTNIANIAEIETTPEPTPTAVPSANIPIEERSLLGWMDNPKEIPSAPQGPSAYQRIRAAAASFGRQLLGDTDIITGEGSTAGSIARGEVSAAALGEAATAVADAGVNITQELATSFWNNLAGRAGSDSHIGSVTLAQLLSGRLNQYSVVPDGDRSEFVYASYARNRLQTNEQWLEPYLLGIKEAILSSIPNLPCHEFFVGSHRGAYRNYTISEAARLRASQAAHDSPEYSILATGRPGRLTVFPDIFEEVNGQPSRLSQVIYGLRPAFTSVDAISNHMRDLQAALYAIAQGLLRDHMGEPEFDQVFPGLGRRAAFSAQMTLHPTYQDLDLPEHPATGQVIDTEPDYYFFNDSEEGYLNEIGPELANEMDDRLIACEATFGQLAGGILFETHYLGRSRTGTESATDGTITGRGVEMMDGVPGGMTIDPSLLTAERILRVIGGIGETDRASIADLCLSMSPTALSGPHGADPANTATMERRRNIFRSSSYSIPNPVENLKVGPIDASLESTDRTHSFARNHIRELLEQAVVQNPDTTLTMRRAFPSFKIYFIEDDIGAQREHLLPGGNTVMYLDDLYNYNSIKSIRLIRSRKDPADLLVLELTNVSGLLERRQWVADPQRDSEVYMPGFEETELENPLKKIILKEGLKVQARLGNTNDPSKMGIKFIGEIVELSFNSECSDEMTIICQSYGAELALEVKSGNLSGTNFRDTPDVCHSIMCSPELVHFGRFDLNPEFNPAEARSAATSRGEENIGGLIYNPQDIIDVGREILTRRRSKWILANNPADDNIYAPRIQDQLSNLEVMGDILGANIMWSVGALNNVRENIYIGNRGATLNTFWWIVRPGARAWLAGANWAQSKGLGVANSIGQWLSTSNYSPPTGTIWDIFQEMELRHPGWVAQPRPYGTRMTMFFGQPNQRYWADQITEAELIFLRQCHNQLNRDYLRSEAGRLATDEQTRSIRHLIPGYGAIDATWRSMGALATSGTASTLAGNLLGLNPFIRSSALWLQRQIRDIRIMSGVGEFFGRTFGRFRPFRRFHLITSEHHLLLNNIRASDKGVFNAVNLQYGGGDLYTLKADDSIPDEKTVTMTFSYPSCDSETLARRYCAGLLARHLKDTYKGEIVVAGMDIDPLDTCFLADKRSGMYGGFEVEQVVDTFTPETGWITEITPDMIVGVNEWASMSTRVAYFGVLGALYQRYIEPVATIDSVGLAVGIAQTTSGVITVPLAAGAYLAYLGGYEIIRWAQDRQPIWISPLLLGDRPYFSGLDGFRQDGIFASIRGRLHAEINNLTDGWRVFHLAGYLSDATVGMAQKAAGQLTE